MVKYLTFGIATKIIIHNKLKENEDLKEKINRLNKTIDLDLYNIEYTTNSVILNIKKDIFEKHAIKFLVEQWESIEYKMKYAIVEAFKTLDGCSYDSIIDAAKMGIVANFRFLENTRISNDISYIDTFGRSDISCDLLTYLVDGKISLQNEECALNYLRNCIINSSYNPIKKAGVINIGEIIE